MLEGLAVAAAVIIATVLIIWVVKVIKQTLLMGLTVFLILAILFFGFSITPSHVLDEFVRLPQHFAEFVGSLVQAGEEITPD